MPTPEDEAILAANNIKLIKENLIEIKKNYIRHDNLSLSKLLNDIAISELKTTS
jgi:hypothetical protein